MTGQGAAHVHNRSTRVAAELRTVNNRYYKLALRISDGYASLEPRVDDIVRKHVRRGTVQLDIRIEREVAADDYRLNAVALGSYLDQVQKLQKALHVDGEIRLDAFLSLPGVVQEDVGSQLDVEEHWPVIEQAVTQALESLTRMRNDEGTAMATDLADNVRLILDQLSRIELLAPRVVEAYRQRLTEKLNKLLGEFGVAAETADVVREVGLFAERTDISEEVVRLRSHLAQFMTVMNAAESNGRKLDFITQEMFREANTIGSKANDAEIAIHVVEIKTAIERIREMIQNVE